MVTYSVGLMDATHTLPADMVAVAGRPRAQAESPGCRPMHLPRDRVDTFEGRLEYGVATETALVGEPATSCHERLSRLLTQLTTRIAEVRARAIRRVAVRPGRRARRDDPAGIALAQHGRCRRVPRRLGRIRRGVR